MKRLRLLTKLKIMVASLLVFSVVGTWLYWKHNIEWSARVAWGEARGEPDSGMHAVLNVMVNRKKDPKFPKSLSGVAKQGFQFSAYNDDDPNKKKLEAVSEEDPCFSRALRLATLAQVGLLPDITDGATYYHSTDIERPVYLKNADVSVTIGRHIFYKDVRWTD